MLHGHTIVTMSEYLQFFKLNIEMKQHEKGLYLIFIVMKTFLGVRLSCLRVLRYIIIGRFQSSL